MANRLAALLGRQGVPLFSSEAVSEGHPDKVADQISDGVLDYFLARDPDARVACETLVTTQFALLAGEFRLSDSAVETIAREFEDTRRDFQSILAGRDPDEFRRIADLVRGSKITKEEAANRLGLSESDLSTLLYKYWSAPELLLSPTELTPTDAVIASIGLVARDCARRIGYQQDGFDWRGLEVLNKMHAQSSDIAQGVDALTPEGQGAGDQGHMFGYACDEGVPEFMPAALWYAHEILRSLTEARHNGEAEGILPDSKSQVTLAYDQSGQPVGVEKIVVSTQHTEGVDDAAKIVWPHVVQAFRETGWVREEDFDQWMKEGRLLVNPTGSFTVGGPDGDTGVTGRKIIVDTYGGAAKHGGGAFSGKDPSKVDRSAAYAARYLAKNVVAAGLAKRCEIQVAYAIGKPDPLSFSVKTFGTGKLPDGYLAKLLPEVFDLRPGKIIEHLDLKKPIYQRTASGGHFGRAPESDGGFSWERLDLVPTLQAKLEEAPPWTRMRAQVSGWWTH